MLFSFHGPINQKNIEKRPTDLAKNIGFVDYYIFVKSGLFFSRIFVHNLKKVLAVSNSYKKVC